MLWSPRRPPCRFLLARGLRDALPGLGEDFTEDSNDLPDFLLLRDQRWGDLDDRIAAIVSAADQTMFEQRRREEPAQQRLGLLFVERLARLLVLHELERVEVAGAAHVADDVEIEQRFELHAKVVLRLRDVLDDLLALHDLEVLQRDRAADGMPAEGDPVRVHRGLAL